MKIVGSAKDERTWGMGSENRVRNMGNQTALIGYIWCLVSGMHTVYLCTGLLAATDSGLKLQAHSAFVSYVQCPALSCGF